MPPAISHPSSKSTLMQASPPRANQKLHSKPIMKPARLDQHAIVAALKGQTLRVPDLTAFLRAWPPAVLHPRHAEVAPVVIALIERIAVSHPPLARRKGDDIAGLISLCYPQAAEGGLETLVMFGVWLVCWDDTVDAGEGDLAGDFDGADRWRSQTLEMIRGALGIDGTDAEKHPDTINAAFQTVGECLSGTTPIDQRRRLYEELWYFITSCAVEQQLRLEQRIPDYDSYMGFRLGTIGGSTLCALVEFANREPLPSAVVAAPQVRELWTQVSTMLTFINDLLSLKKELGTDCVINAVTSLLSPEKGLDEVVGELEHKLRQAVDDFDRVAGELFVLVDGDEEQSGVVTRYINGCRSIVTGTLEFT
ncbi:isoprenoid synthase domain-containing protein [Ilyonectria robusta]|uniref:isoprenoid synthase domain-containing protein n=1 Tax=Ilyonectria robusta TaxID=1079257 RepID=UPI001E8E7219|nr:isoprenoid synthase domain-containing protein [Ilyonectria robusta]KAH8737320.1 isoprenoid synthase domain-containing protein [Ilyonectria robusta]